MQWTRASLWRGAVALILLVGPGLAAAGAQDPTPAPAPAPRPATDVVPAFAPVAAGPPVRVLLYSGPGPVTLDLGSGPQTVSVQDVANDPQPQCPEDAFRLEGKPYRGRLAVLREGSRLLLVDEVPLEDYLRGVVPRELGCDQLEALKAQAVVARTYALAHLRAGQAYDFLGTDRNQVYSGTSPETPLADRAVRETAGVVLEHNKSLARDVMYHSTCGGATEDNDQVFPGSPVAYLRGVPCRWCEASPYYHWSLEASSHDLGQEVEHLLGKPVVPLTGLEPLERLPSGRLRRLRVQCATAGLELRGDDMRRCLRGKDPEGKPRSLYSTRFEAAFEPRPDGSVVVVFTGRGWGHGVGMCQWGALGMARAGRDYREILNYYFSGAEVAALEP